MKYWQPVTILIIIAVLGCSASMEQVRTKNRENLLRLSIGLGELDVLQIMGTETIGNINNPYRKETPMGEDGELYVVFFYHTDIKKDDKLITDDELTPIVLKDNQLIGWGWVFLSQIVPNY